MKHILIITLNNSSPKGGSEKLWRQIAQEGASRGHKVTVSVYKHQRDYNKEKLNDVVSIRTRIPKRFGETIISRIAHHLLGGILEHRQIIREISVCKPDFVFYSFGGFAELDNPTMLSALVRTRVPYATVFHSNTENYAFDVNSIAQTRQFWEKSSNNFVVSHRIAEIFKRQIGMKELGYKLAINPMEQVKMCSIDIYKDVESVVKLAFVGTLDIEVKGIALLLQVLAEIKLDRPEWELNLYGEGTDRDLIQELIFQFELDHRVHLKGWTDNINEVWNSHHLLLLPSFNEGMPMVVHEAMLRKRVVITTDVGGNAEIIKNDVTGYLSPSASFKHLKQTMESAFAARNKWGTIAEAARESILESRKLGSSIVEILNEIEHELH